MADNNNTIKTTVELDANQAQQEIVKLNAKASDSTKTLQERVDAKNKAVKLQNELSKKTIKALEDEQNELIKNNASLKDIEKISKKLNRERLKATKLTANNEKQQSKLNEALEVSKTTSGKLSEATGGLSDKLKLLAANPIILVVTALVGAFKFLSEAVNRSGKASETFGKIGAKISGIFNGLLAVVEPLVEFIGDKLLFAIENPKKAFLELGETIKNNVINRFKALTILGGAVAKLFKGDFKGALKDATDGFVQLNTGIEGGIEKISEYTKVAKKKYNEVANATEKLANAERRLAKNQIALEKQQLTSLRLAEEQRQIRDDVSKTIEERIAANKKLGEILDIQAKKELSIAQQNLNIARQQQKATGDEIGNIEAVGAAEVKLLEIRERITGQKSEQLVNEQSLIKEAADIELANLESLNNSKIELAKLNGEETLQLELDILEKKKAKELENKTLTEVGKKEIEERYRLEKETLEKEAEEKKAEKETLRKENLLELEELEIERLKEKGENTLQRELALLEKRRVQEVSNAKLTAEQIELINKKSDAEKEKLREADRIATEEKEKAKLNSIVNATAEAFGISKEVALAESVFGLGKSIGDAWTANAKLGFPGNLIATAAQISAQVPPIMKSIQSIKSAKISTKGGNIGGGGGSISTSSISQGIGSPSSSISSNVVSDLTSNNAARLGVNTNLGSAASSDASNNVVGSASNNIVFSESKYNDFQNQIQFKEDKTII